MPTPLERANAERAAAQAKIDALSRVPETEDYPVGTILAFGTADTYQVAVKSVSGFWMVTGRDGHISWDTLVALYLTRSVENFDIVTAFGDAFISPPMQSVTQPDLEHDLDQRLNNIESRLTRLEDDPF